MAYHSPGPALSSTGQAPPPRPAYLKLIQGWEGGLTPPTFSPDGFVPEGQFSERTGTTAAGPIQFSLLSGPGTLGPTIKVPGAASHPPGGHWPMCGPDRMLVVVAVQLLSRVRLFETPWTAAHQASLFFTISWSLLKLLSVESVMSSNHLILCCPLLLPSLFPSIGVFSNELALGIRWPKYWSFSISSSNEYTGLISFRIDWFDLLAAQGTVKSLLLHHSSKASVLWLSDFFMVQLSHPYMTTGKIIALTIPTFVKQRDVSAF